MLGALEITLIILGIIGFLAYKEWLIHRERVIKYKTEQEQKKSKKKKEEKSKGGMDPTND